MVGDMVEYSLCNSDDIGWRRDALVSLPDNGEFAFELDKHYARAIREIPTIKLTLAELYEKYGVPDNVVIVEGD